MKDLAIFGVGGFGREVLQIVDDINQAAPTWNLVGFLDDDESKWGTQVCNLPVLGSVEWLLHHRHTALVLALGSPVSRRRTALELARLGDVCFATLVHPAAWVSRRVTMGHGTVVDAGALISPDAQIGRHVVLNNNCTVGHDTILEDFVTVAPNASIAGEVRIAEGCDIGANSTIIQGHSVGHWSVVGAGAVVVRDLPANVTAVGMPARAIKQRVEGWHEEL